MNGAPLTFDSIPREVVTTLESHREVLTNLEWLLVNRDLNGRVRLIAPERVQSDEALRQGIEDLAATLAERLGVHGYPASRMVLYEASQEQVRRGAAIVPLGGFENVFLVDRLATEGDWANIADESPGPPRVVFFSIKGGVGRSTALAATAWWLAQAGKRVLVVDLDLESPGLSSSLLPTERLPRFGVTDWLVEDLVENAEIVFKDMIATSGLAHDGEIIVVPAHGAEPGEYIAKLGRVRMAPGKHGSTVCAVCWLNWKPTCTRMWCCWIAAPVSTRWPLPVLLNWEQGWSCFLPSMARKPGMDTACCLNIGGAPRLRKKSASACKRWPRWCRRWSA